MTNSGPGWFPDSTDASLMRYWDGQKWTEHTAPAGQAPGVAQESYPQAVVATPDASRPWFKKKRFAIPLGLVVLLVIISALGGGGGDSEPVTASDTSNSSASAEPSDDTAAADQAAADQAAADQAAADQAAADQAAAAQAAAEAAAEKKAAVEKKAAAEKAAAAIVSVSAGEIVTAFEENEAAADAKYGGKTLRVTGVVSSVDTEFFDDEKYILAVGTGGDFEFFGVNCNGMSGEEVASISKGDNVTVVGKFDDGGDLGVEMTDCSLV